ncbi:MAG TPA: peptidylprolyl isomerase [Gammaproteobacteria bacterium]|jgi:peptidyl-prolyl cis-trans isomerase C|nr:peptidylprolyl isomerase [Gammaproteobacteria bacterium]
MQRVQCHRPESLAGHNFPEVSVGGRCIEASRIARELQYHPATALKDAWHAAATSLVIHALLVCRADQLKIQADSDEQRIALLLERELRVPDPNDAQCRRYFQNNRSRFHTPVLLQVSHILLIAQADDSQRRDQQRALAARMLEQLTADPEAFAELARQHSACPSAKQGGALGQLTKGQTVAEFEQEVWRLPQGLWPHPLETRYGVHIVRVDHRAEGLPLNYSDAADRIRQYLHEQATRTALSQYLQLLSQEIGVTGINFTTADSPLVQ